MPPGWPTGSSSRSGSRCWNGCTAEPMTERIPGRVFERMAEEDVAGVTRVPVPVGVNRIETVNVYVLADGDHVTLVDCGVWRPEPDGEAGVRALETGLQAAGYALRDV